MISIRDRKTIKIKLFNVLNKSSGIKNENEMVMICERIESECFSKSNSRELYYKNVNNSLYQLVNGYSLGNGEKCDFNNNKRTVINTGSVGSDNDVFQNGNVDGNVFLCEKKNNSIDFWNNCLIGGKKMTNGLKETYYGDHEQSEINLCNELIDQQAAVKNTPNNIYGRQASASINQKIVSKNESVQYVRNNGNISMHYTRKNDNMYLLNYGNDNRPFSQENKMDPAHCDYNNHKFDKYADVNHNRAVHSDANIRQCMENNNISKNHRNNAAEQSVRAMAGFVEKNEISKNKINSDHNGVINSMPSQYLLQKKIAVQARYKCDAVRGNNGLENNYTAYQHGQKSNYMAQQNGQNMSDTSVDKIASTITQNSSLYNLQTNGRIIFDKTNSPQNKQIKTIKGNHIIKNIHLDKMGNNRDNERKDRAYNHFNDYYNAADERHNAQHRNNEYAMKKKIYENTNTPMNMQGSTNNNQMNDLSLYHHNKQQLNSLYFANQQPGNYKQMRNRNMAALKNNEKNAKNGKLNYSDLCGGLDRNYTYDEINGQYVWDGSAVYENMYVPEQNMNYNMRGNTGGVMMQRNNQAANVTNSETNGNMFGGNGYQDYIQSFGNANVGYGAQPQHEGGIMVGTIDNGEITSINGQETHIYFSNGQKVELIIPKEFRESFRKQREASSKMKNGIDNAPCEEQNNTLAHNNVQQPVFPDNNYHPNNEAMPYKQHIQRIPQNQRFTYAQAVQQNANRGYQTNNYNNAFSPNGYFQAKRYSDNNHSFRNAPPIDPSNIYDGNVVSPNGMYGKRQINNGYPSRNCPPQISEEQMRAMYNMKQRNVAGMNTQRSQKYNNQIISPSRMRTPAKNAHVGNRMNMPMGANDSMQNMRFNGNQATPSECTGPAQYNNRDAFIGNRSAEQNIQYTNKTMPSLDDQIAAQNAYYNEQFLAVQNYYQSAMNDSINYQNTNVDSNQGMSRNASYQNAGMNQHVMNENPNYQNNINNDAVYQNNNMYNQNAGLSNDVHQNNVRATGNYPAQHSAKYSQRTPHQGNTPRSNGNQMQRNYANQPMQKMADQPRKNSLKDIADSILNGVCVDPNFKNSNLPNYRQAKGKMPNMDILELQRSRRTVSGKESSSLDYIKKTSGKPLYSIGGNIVAQLSSVKRSVGNSYNGSPNKNINMSLCSLKELESGRLLRSNKRARVQSGRESQASTPGSNQVYVNQSSKYNNNCSRDNDINGSDTKYNNHFNTINRSSMATREDTAKEDPLKKYKQLSINMHPEKRVDTFEDVPIDMPGEVRACKNTTSTEEAEEHIKEDEQKKMKIEIKIETKIETKEERTKRMIMEIKDISEKDRLTEIIEELKQQFETNKKKTDESEEQKAEKTADQNDTDNKDDTIESNSIVLSALLKNENETVLSKFKDHLKMIQSVFIAYDEKIKQDLTYKKYKEISRLVSDKNTDEEIGWFKDVIERLRTDAEKALEENGHTTDFNYHSLIDNSVEQFGKKLKKDGKFCITLGKSCKKILKL